MPEGPRHGIDSGRTDDKVSAPDPAVTPLGTDEEAPGSAPDAEAVSRDRKDKRRSAVGIPGFSARPHHPRPGGSLALRGAVLAILALLLVGLFIAS
jgi:hypothetical protein